MRITSWNFLHGQVIKPAEGSSALSPLDEALNQIASEVIALQEVDLHLERSGNKNQAEEIAISADARHWGFAPTLNGTPGFSWRKLRRDEEQVITKTSPEIQDLYGLAIISSIPVKEWLRLELGKAWIGLPLLVANEKGKVAPFYVKDEPRVALAVVLENGWTIINVHLSFVPLVNIYQLFKVSRWAKKLEHNYSTKVALVGDFNLPWGIPARITRWKRATMSNSYPSWKPSISFDYILMKGDDCASAKEVVMPQLPISDHRPVTVEVKI
jgi:endonuclease/exonuclease/phosphatase family metal-dependent hydrolase